MRRRKSKNNKAIIVIVILALLVLGCALAWFVLRDTNDYEYSIEESFRNNISIDIGEVNTASDGRSLAIVNITMPNIADVFRETMDSFGNLDGVADDAFYNRLVSNMPNHSVSMERELEVTQDNGEWHIRDERYINNLIEGQLDSLIMELLLLVDFDPINITDFPPIN